MGKAKESKDKDKESQEESILADFPGDIKIEIISKIPAEILWKNFMCADKAWNKVISSNSFFYKHIGSHPKSAGLLTQLCYGGFRLNFKTYLLEMSENKIDLKSYRLVKEYTGYISSSCNGFVVETVYIYSNCTRTPVVHIKNYLTGFDMIIPNCPSGCEHSSYNCSLELGFNPNTMEYKLVHISYYMEKYGFELFTIGVDKVWRRVEGFVQDYPNPWWKPVFVDGKFLHWLAGEEYVHSMDIWNEKFSKTKLPKLHCHWALRYRRLIELDGKVALIDATSNTEFNVWVLNGLWYRKHTIRHNCTNFIKSNCPWIMFSGKEIANILPTFINLRAVASLENGNKIIFLTGEPQTRAVLYLYDMKHRVMRKHYMDRYYKSLIPHQISLGGAHQISLDGAAGANTWRSNSSDNTWRRHSKKRFTWRSSSS